VTQILVTGGSGVLGRDVVRQLLTAGREGRVLSRAIPGTGAGGRLQAVAPLVSGGDRGMPGRAWSGGVPVPGVVRDAHGGLTCLLTIHACLPTCRPRENPYCSKSSTVVLNRKRPGASRDGADRQQAIKAHQLHDTERGTGRYCQPWLAAVGGCLVVSQ